MAGQGDDDRLPGLPGKGEKIFSSAFSRDDGSASAAIPHTDSPAEEAAQPPVIIEVSFVDVAALPAGSTCPTPPMRDLAGDEAPWQIVRTDDAQPPVAIDAQSVDVTDRNAPALRECRCPGCVCGDPSEACSLSSRFFVTTPLADDV